LGPEDDDDDEGEGEGGEDEWLFCSESRASCSPDKLSDPSKAVMANPDQGCGDEGPAGLVRDPAATGDDCCESRINPSSKSAD
jgi:hypothetical protein